MTERESLKQGSREFARDFRDMILNAPMEVVRDMIVDLLDRLPYHERLALTFDSIVTVFMLVGHDDSTVRLQLAKAITQHGPRARIASLVQAFNLVKIRDTYGVEYVTRVLDALEQHGPLLLNEDDIRPLNIPGEA